MGYRIGPKHELANLKKNEMISFIRFNIRLPGLTVYESCYNYNFRIAKQLRYSFHLSQSDEYSIQSKNSTDAE